MPVCSLSPPSLFSFLVLPFVLSAKSFLSIFLFDAPFPGYVPDFRCRCRFSSPCASTCVHLRINPSSLFFRRYFIPFVIPPLRLFRDNPRVAVMSCVTFISQLMYQFLITFSFPANDQYFITFSLLYFWLFARLNLNGMQMKICTLYSGGKYTHTYTVWFAFKNIHVII